MAEYTYVRAHKRQIVGRGRKKKGGVGKTLAVGAVAGLGALAVKKFGVGKAVKTLRSIIQLYKKKKAAGAGTAVVRAAKRTTGVSRRR